MSDLDWRSHPGVRQSKLCYPLRIPVFHAEVTVIIGLKRTQSGNIHSTELSDSETVDRLRYARGPVLKPTVTYIAKMLFGSCKVVKLCLNQET